MSSSIHPNNIADVSGDYTPGDPEIVMPFAPTGPGLLTLVMVGTQESVIIGMSGGGLEWMEVNGIDVGAAHLKVFAARGTPDASDVLLELSLGGVVAKPYRVSAAEFTGTLLAGPFSGLFGQANGASTAPPGTRVEVNLDPIGLGHDATYGAFWPDDIGDVYTALDPGFASLGAFTIYKDDPDFTIGATYQPAATRRHLVVGIGLLAASPPLPPLSSRPLLGVGR